MTQQHNAERLLKLIEEIYRWLPLGTIVNNRVFVVHGGISDSTDLDLLKSLDRGKVSAPIFHFNLFQFSHILSRQSVSFLLELYGFIVFILRTIHERISCINNTPIRGNFNSPFSLYEISVFFILLVRLGFTPTSFR